MRPVRMLLVPAMLLLTPALCHAQATTVASVNAGKVFADIKETNAMREKLETEGRSLQAMARDKQERINQLQKERDQLKPDSPQFADKNRELMNAAIDIRTWREVAQMDLERAQKQQMRDVFVKIEVTVAAIAKERGIDLVVAEQGTELPDTLEAIKLDQLRAALNSRNVLFSSGAADLTSEVIAKMDAAYQTTP